MIERYIAIEQEEQCTDQEKRIINLGAELMNQFYRSLKPSDMKQWKGSDDVRVRSEYNIHGAATSVRLPVSRKGAFSFLNDAASRYMWDCSSIGCGVKQIASLKTGLNGEDCVTILCLTNIELEMVVGHVLQECWNDDSASTIVYTPICLSDISSTKGGTSFSMFSGFIIHDDGHPPVGTSSSSSSSIVTSGGSIVTISFQAPGSSDTEVVRVVAERAQLLKSLFY